jgi:hypothetical protein
MYYTIFLGSRGSEVIVTEYEQKQKLKAIYIPRCCRGEITNLVASQLIGIAPRNVTKLKRRYEAIGNKAFIRADRGHKPYTRKYNDEYENKILMLYHTYYPDTPYRTFWRGLRDIEHITIPYETLRYILRKHNIKSVRYYKPKEKPKHESRREREHEGELVQMDASKHDWYMNGKYENLHGGIDDARHIITGLYMCDNECRLGYGEVLRQTFTNYGVMRAVYIDRHSSFVTNPKTDITLSERVEAARNSDTHFVELCHRLNIEIILALSAEGKGRIERLWETLQGILPYLFRRLDIHDNQSANSFLSHYINTLNQDFSVSARSPRKLWRKCPENLDYLLAIKFRKRTDSMGYFLFHSHYFRITAPRVCHKDFKLLISEKFGVKALVDGKYYDVTLEDVLTSVRGEDMPIVEQDLISRFLLSDVHSDIV